MNGNTNRIVIVVALALALGACASEREPINRVQADALAKSFFVGDDLLSPSDNPSFYANGTLIDMGYGASVNGLFTAFYSNDLSIIRWDITEEFLIGRLAYERVDGTDGKGAGLDTNDGQVLYAFAISKHFDIQHGYNPSTGEELNIIEENTTDRPWYERRYMRVDWSANLVTDAYDFDTLALYGAQLGLEWQPVNYYINDPAHPDAPHFEADEGYFDITNRAYLTPGMVDLSKYGWGTSQLPACFLDGDFFGGTAPGGNCNPVEVTIRNSFWKKPDSDYEPQDWDGFMFQAAGPFVKERYGYARNYGMSDTQWRRFISRYDIWAKSHSNVECFTPETTPVGEDPKRDIDGNGTHDECETATFGSRCDIFSQKCTIPYRQRETKPIVWYYTIDSDPFYFEPTNLARQDWDAAMRVAVMAAKNAECFRVDGVDCDADFPAPKGQMGQMQDLIETIREVDACLAAAGSWTPSDCADVAAAELKERGYAPDGSYDYEALHQAATMDHMVVLCHSPVEAGDHPACAPGKPRLPKDISAEMCDEARHQSGDKWLRAACDRAYNVRIGDVRRHLIHVVQSPQTPSPWGFGPTYADPLTGEAISASINVWSAPTATTSQSVVDAARFIAGELSIAEVTDGVYVKDWADAAQIAANKGAMPPMTRAQRDARLGNAIRGVGRALDTGDVVDVGAGDPDAPLSPEVVASAQELGALRNVRADAHGHSVFAPTYRARMKAGMDSETEAALITPAMLQWAGATELPIDVGTELASPLRGNFNPTLSRDARHVREAALAERGACMLDADYFAPSPTAMLSLTKVLQEKFGAFNAADPVSVQLERAKKMQRWLGARMHYSVIVHEMGHTFGFRHNFVSSSSAINYRPQYWQLRTRNGAVNTKCSDLTNTEQEAADCIGPRYYDQLTQEESDEGIWMWMHSSVMDYAGDYTQDMLGLGGYDFAAARMFYGETATVFADPDFNDGTDLSLAITDTVLDNFGGILGYHYRSKPPVGGLSPSTNFIHYSELNTHYNLIAGCTPVDPEVFRPSAWDEERDGTWSPLMDGLIVKVDGVYSRCKQRRVAYVPWDRLRRAIGSDSRIGPAIDPINRTRVPYGFGTDRWADLGNLSVYRHDNGADPYELFNFFIAEQEVRHIFDNYRRNRQGFSVRSASKRTLTRYNEKMRDGAKGMGLIANNTRATGLKIGLESTSYFDAIVRYWGWGDNMLASGVAFDHFARQAQRPQPGPHIDRKAPNTDVSVVLRYNQNSTDPLVIVPDGPQGFWNTVGMGGKLVNNSLSDVNGEYDVQYTLNAGSYYDKAYVAMLFTESVDNFVSSSLDDFTDARRRAVSMADLFPDGYRRWLANNLTLDDFIKAPRVAANGLFPDTLPDGYPSMPLGWTSWWPDTPELCFPAAGTTVCSAYDKDGASFSPMLPADTRAIDPQIDWEQFKLFVVNTLIYLPENQKQTWLDMLGIWEIGADSDPGFDQRIELHMPSGNTYVARSFGSEEICFELCKTVQRGIGARILEFANQLLNDAYENTPVTQNGVTWYLPLFVDGNPVVKFDPELEYVGPNFTTAPPPPTCNPSDNSGCACNNNGACLALESYVSLPDFVRTAMRDFKMADPTMKGIY